MAEKSRRTTIYLTPENFRRLRLRAAESGCSLSDLVNDLLSKGEEVVPAEGTYPPVPAGGGRVEETAADYLALAERLQAVEQRLGIGLEPREAITLQEVEDRIASQSEELHALGVATLSVFGSVARGEEKPTSDIDMIVDFNGPAGLFRLMEVKERLESLLGAEVDLTTTGGLHPELKQRILEESVRVL